MGFWKTVLAVVVGVFLYELLFTLAAVIYALTAVPSIGAY